MVTKFTFLNINYTARGQIDIWYTENSVVNFRRIYSRMPKDVPDDFAKKGKDRLDEILPNDNSVDPDKRF